MLLWLPFLVGLGVFTLDRMVSRRRTKGPSATPTRTTTRLLYRSGDFYASAAAAGALVTFALHGVSPTASVVAGAVVTMGIRIGSRLAGLRLPVPRSEA